MKGVIYRMAQQVPVEEIRRPEPAIIKKKKKKSEEQNEKWDRPFEFSPHLFWNTDCALRFVTLNAC